MQQYQLPVQRICTILALSVVWLLVACTPVIRPPDVEQPAPTTQEENPASEQARQQLAQTLAVDAATITVVSAEAMEWPDACLGAPAADEMCAQMQTPGYQVTLAVDGNEYLYHTNEDGSVVRPAPAPEDVVEVPGNEPQLFFVESVEVRGLESDPVQVEAVVRGQLADSCTSIQGATVEVKEQTFVITLATDRPADRMCAQVVTPFEQVVALEVAEPGEYAVQVGEVVEPFTVAE